MVFLEHVNIMMHKYDNFQPQILGSSQGLGTEPQLRRWRSL